MIVGFSNFSCVVWTENIKCVAFRVKILFSNYSNIVPTRPHVYSNSIYSTDTVLLIQETWYIPSLPCHAWYARHAHHAFIPERATSPLERLRDMGGHVLRAYIQHIILNAWHTLNRFLREMHLQVRYAQRCKYLPNPQCHVQDKGYSHCFHFFSQRDIK